MNGAILIECSILYFIWRRIRQSDSLPFKEILVYAFEDSSSKAFFYLLPQYDLVHYIAKVHAGMIFMPVNNNENMAIWKKQQTIE